MFYFVVLLALVFSAVFCLCLFAFLFDVLVVMFFSSFSRFVVLLLCVCVSPNCGVF